MDHNLKDIFELFQTNADFREGHLYGNGHIHDTYFIETVQTDQDNYILQRLNNHVFKDIPKVQKNIERITQHLREKISLLPGSDIKRECLELIFSRDGKSWITDREGNYWRMYIFITDNKSYDVVDTPERAYEGGKAIGRFQAMLADLPGMPLFETIPSFHDVEKRIDNLIRVLKKDPVGRERVTERETEFILRRSDDMRIINQLGREGKIPVRITHNDTKFNNILFDQNDRSLCVIDLDTVMPGYFHSDFGDTIRTGANLASEDEKDLSAIEMDISLFEAFASGYLSEMRDTLNNVEKEYLAFAPLLMTYEQALRFLSDYINGDTYYKISHENHNLERARAQIKLLERMESQFVTMQAMIRKLI
ncbi:MAG: aminoglycoside phosphotransferase family protein [Bacteroidales bacterium]|nr:aminoglycoside phosphotransferase family protein [Bacteroidales bacterium]